MRYTPHTLQRLQNLIWVLIYVGLFALVVGGIARQEDNLLGTLLMIVGAAAAVVGVVLIWVRSRMTPEAPTPHPRGRG